MTQKGYYRYPTIFGDTVVFVSEGDLWRVSKENPVARRLTFNRGQIKYPVFSPDGKYLAFSASDEGHSEVYTMPAEGGEIKRLTFLGDMVNVVGWTHEGIYFVTAAGEPFVRINVVHRITPDGLIHEKLPIGQANYIAFKNMQETGCVAIQRHGYREYSYWKRYRGGTAGTIWVDQDGNGSFKQLIALDGDLARPLILDNRIYFSSDHEGIGNLYSCTLEGFDLRQETHHQEFYVRNQSTDGKRIVYHAGADLFVFEPQSGKSEKLEVTYNSDRPGRSRKFFNIQRYLQGYHLHPNGHYLSLISRGKACFFSNWEGPVLQIGDLDGVRYRDASWLVDGKRVLVVCESGVEDSLEIYSAEDGSLLSKPKTSLEIGRVTGLWVNPKTDHVALTNHAHELLIVDLKKWTCQKVDRSEFGAPSGCSWSPDGLWLAYSTTVDRKRRAIKLLNLKDKKITQITNPILRDECPTFDPEGKYLFFLSWRHFEPTWDCMHFDLGFHFAVKPYAITLQKDLTSPFLKAPESLETKGDKKDEEKDGSDKKDKKQKDHVIQIDLEGIEERIVEFPIMAGEYSHLQAGKGKVFFITHPLEPAPVHYFGEEKDESHTSLDYFDLDTLRLEHVVTGVSDFHFAADHEMMVYRINEKLRVVKVGEKPDEDKGYTKKSGWINFGRIKLSVNRVLEWQQMYKEAWLLQRDHYWVEDMSKIDWQNVYDRYYPLLARISSREEFTDLLWEMQGELGTSHAYVLGGDLKQEPTWTVGSLAADFEYDFDKKAFRFTNIAKGDVWDLTCGSPLHHPGVKIQEGDYLLSINKRPVTAERTPGAMLVNLAEQEVELEVADYKMKHKRSVIVKTLASQNEARYRDWVENNRRYIHEKSQGRVGYIHIPDMSPHGFAEFHRAFLCEIDRAGLIVDVRFNGGGNVSQLLLEKLARRRLGYDVTRWQGMLPYPEDAPLGPMVALTNEYAGSDGDIFSHSFKVMKLGPLIGKRSWGGVIGIFPRFPLIDGGLTTQPEYSFWFKDVGWSVENYGVDPDIEVEIAPQDYRAGKDPQMDRALIEIEKILATTQEDLPEIDKRPNLKSLIKLQG